MALLSHRCVQMRNAVVYDVTKREAADLADWLE